MPIDATIPLSYKQVDPTATIGAIANTANALTQFRRGQVQLEQDTGALDARKKVSALLADPENHAEDGTLDMNKFAAKAYQVDPKNYVASEFISKGAQANNDMTVMKSNAMKLGDQTQAYAGQRIGALSLDPNITKKEIHGALDDIVAISGPAATEAKRIADITKKHLENFPDDPKVLGPAMAKWRNLTFPISTQVPQVAYAQTAAENVPVQTQPLAGAVGPVPGAPRIPMGVAPTATQQQKVDIAGNPYLEKRDQQGNIVNEPLPGSNGPPPLLRRPPGEDQTSWESFARGRLASNQAALQVPEQHFNNKQIMHLADVAWTGTGSEALAAFFSTNGLQWVPGDKAANYQQLTHFLALQAQKNAQVMGAGTDAARSIAQQATGSSQWDPQAIKRSTKVVDALATGVEMFNRGLEAAINHPQNDKSLYAARDFQNTWAQNFDVQTMRLLNAHQNGDAKELALLLTEVGGAKSPAAKALAARARTLDNLIKTGRP